MSQQIYQKIINELLNLKNPTDNDVKKILQKNPISVGKIAKKSEILKAYKSLKKTAYKNLSTGDEKKLLQLIQLKKVRTLSGVTPVTVLTKPFPCPGQCIFCPNDANMPKSYLSSEPGAQRAAHNKFDPYFQTYNRLVAFSSMGHPTDKIELIILGGTWSVYPEAYQIWFTKRCFEAMNDFNSETAAVLEPVTPLPHNETCTWENLFETQKINETAKSRCTGLVVETRPEFVTPDEIIKFRKFGATKVQLGIQSLDDEVLQKSKRGHTVAHTAKAFSLLRQAGFKIHGHWMPNLYGSTPQKDIADYAKLFNPDFCPDELKIYPCSLLAGTELMNLYKKGLWQPYTKDELLEVLTAVFMKTPRYCRLTRVIRDIPSTEIVAGNKTTNFRQVVDAHLRELSLKPVEIRSREIRGVQVDINELKLKVTAYKTLVSEELFLEYVTSEDNLAGFLRLSLSLFLGDNTPENTVANNLAGSVHNVHLPAEDEKTYKTLNPHFITELTGAAIIREIHVYGQSIHIGATEEGKAQHIGLGKKLIAEAKRLAKEKGFKKLAVISSVGTREYYRKNGFSDGELYQFATL